MKTNTDFWKSHDTLAAQSDVIIDRPKNSVHPRFPTYVYPFDYRYFKNTISADGMEMDIWQIAESKTVTGILVTYDPEKKDSEIKVLLGTLKNEAEIILPCHRRGDMEALLIMQNSECYDLIDSFIATI